MLFWKTFMRQMETFSLLICLAVMQHSFPKNWEFMGRRSQITENIYVCSSVIIYEPKEAVMPVVWNQKSMGFSWPSISFPCVFI